MFYWNTTFNQDIGDWDTGAMTTMTNALRYTTQFDQDISDWNISGVTSFGDLMQGDTLSTANYDALLSGWEAQSVVSGISIHFGSSVYTNCGAVEIARAALISSDGWTITDGGGTPAVCPSAFTFTMNTENAGSATKTFVLPLVNDGTIDILVDWGDSSTDTITTYNQSEITHVYSSTGTYTVQLSGTIRGFKFSGGGDKLKILNISKWGDMNITQCCTFQGCTNLTSNATDAPSIGTTDLTYMFFQCSNFNQDIDNWDVSGVTQMDAMFNQASSFNQDLNSWDTSSCLDMQYLFNNATAFNGNISSWDTSNVVNMASTFYGSAFNSDISSWDVSSVTTMYGTFRSNTVFDQDISSWDLGACTTIGVMFDGSTAFNQDIGGWDTSQVTTMYGTFRNATSFDQDISDWNISGVTAFDIFLQGVTLSTANYDALLLGWDAQSVVSGVSFDGGSSVYTNCGTVAAARANLISSDSWTITDGGGDPVTCPPFTFTVNTALAGSDDTQFKLPLNYISGHIWDIDVDWGDGTTDTVTGEGNPIFSSSATHTYSASGVYTIQMTNPVSGFDFNNGGDKLKILNISKWGQFIFTGGGWAGGAGYQAFRRCANLTSDATDTPTIDLLLWDFMFEGCTNWNPNNIESWDMSTVTKMNWMFFGCTYFNQPIGAWDTSNVYELSYMLYNCPAFDQNLSNWDVEAVTNYSQFMGNAGVSTANYDALLIGWAAQSVSSGEAPSFGSSKYTGGGTAAAARATLIAAPNSWTITDGGIA